MEDLIFNILPVVGLTTDKMDDKVIRVIITDKNHNEKGVLYFEKVKVGFNRKPISMNSWACVDAKVEELYDMGGDYSSLDILNRCQGLISSFISSGQNTIYSGNNPTDK